MTQRGAGKRKGTETVSCINLVCLSLNFPSSFPSDMPARTELPSEQLFFVYSVFILAICFVSHISVQISLLVLAGFGVSSFNPTSRGACSDSLLGEEECRCTYGTYELVIPVDNDLSCDDPGMTNENCREFQVH